MTSGKERPDTAAIKHHWVLILPDGQFESRSATALPPGSRSARALGSVVASIKRKVPSTSALPQARRPTDRKRRDSLLSPVPVWCRVSWGMEGSWAVLTSQLKNNTNCSFNRQDALLRTLACLFSLSAFSTEARPTGRYFEARGTCHRHARV